MGIRLAFARVARQLEERMVLLAAAVLPSLGRGTRLMPIDPTVQRERRASAVPAPSGPILDEPLRATARAR